VLLVGDSFAFGELLDQKDTIAASMERLDPRREVINLGVTGYNLPEQLERLRRCSLPAREVVYLFYGNDLEPPVEQTIIDGYRVRLLRLADGSPMPDGEMRRAAARQIERIEQSRRLTLGSLLLPRVRQTLRDYRARATNGPRDAFGRDEARRTRAIEHGVQATEEMRNLAAERGMSFLVAIVPSLEETRARAYQPAVSRYMAAVEARGISVLDLLPSMSADHYWRHDGHFNAGGASVAARTIDKALGRDQ